MLTPLAYFLIVMILVAAGAVVLDQRNFIFGSLFIFSMILGVLAAYLKLTGYVIDQHWTALALALLAFPVVALLAIIVWLVHNTNIISHREGKSFTAKLSLFLALTLGLDFYLLFLVGNVHGAYARFAYISGLGVYNTFLLLFISYLLYSFVYQIWPTPKKADYIIVLGSYIHNGRVTPLLQSRVDKALAYYRAAAADHRPKLVVSGGQGADESTSEANAMKEYLLSVGVPDQDIIVEDQSRNTFENFMFSKEKILQDWQGQNGQQPVILFATSNYHVMRASLYSKRIGFRARGIGAPTSFYFLPTALIREYVGILSYYRIIAFMLFVFEAFLAYLLAF